MINDQFISIVKLTGCKKLLYKKNNIIIIPINNGIYLIMIYLLSCHNNTI